MNDDPERRTDSDQPDAPQPDSQPRPVSSRQRLVDAALEEFARNGLAGARVEAIGRRAGLNKQLISYYFGGKTGLYQETLRWCFERSTDPSPPESVPKLLASYFRAVVADPETTRLLQWEALGDDDGPSDDARMARLQAVVGYLADEQSAGRIPSDYEPALLALSLLGAAQYPAAFPQITRMLTGRAPSDQEFGERYADHLVRLASHLLSARRGLEPGGRREEPS